MDRPKAVIGQAEKMLEYPYDTSPVVVPDRTSQQVNSLVKQYMYFNLSKTKLLILGIVSIVCSRTLFLFVNDPEGPNLLIVLGFAVIIYLAFLAVYLYYQRTK